MAEITCTKENIINSAIDLFSENGYTETSIRAIANRAGIKESSIYYHFNTKNDILNQITEEYINMVKSNILKMPEFKTNIPSVDEIIDTLCFKFPDENNEKFKKMLQIVWHEQFRCERVQAFFVNNIFIDFNYIFGDLIKILSKHYEISMETNKLSEIVNSVLLTYSLKSCHNPVQQTTKRMEEQTRDILREIVNLTFKLRENIAV